MTKEGAGAIASYPILEAVRRQRRIAKFAHEERITLRGPSGAFLSEIILEAHSLRTKLELEEENYEWIEKQREQLRSMRSMDRDSVEEAFDKCLCGTITMEYRTWKNLGPENITQLRDPNYLETLILSAAANFINTLRIAQRLGIAPPTALEIAKYSYHHKPTKLIKLRHSYPNLPLYVLVRSLISNPFGPEKFLEGVVEATKQLKTKYPSVPPGIITDAAVRRPSNPEGFIERILEIAESHPGVGLTTIVRMNLEI